MIRTRFFNGIYDSFEKIDWRLNRDHQPLLPIDNFTVDSLITRCFLKLRNKVKDELND